MTHECDLDRKDSFRKLHIGESCILSVYARLVWNDYPLRVSKGERYRFAASGCWYDASIPAGPSGYSEDRLIFQIAARFRRCPSENWFALIGSIGQDESNVFLIGNEARVTMSQSGALNFFANDLPLFYGINSGAIRLEVTREA